MKRIKAACGELKGKKQEAARYIVENAEIAAFLSIGELAEKIGTSPSTLTRTAAAIGYGSFTEMQRDVQDYIRLHLRSVLPPMERLNHSPLAPNSLKEFDFRASFAWDIQNIQTTMNGISDNLLKKAVLWLTEARRINVAGIRTQYSSASFFSIVLGQIREGVFLVPQDESLYQEWITRLRPKDVFFSICLPRYGAGSVMLTQEAARAGCKIIVVTDHEVSPSGVLADLVLPVEYESVSFFNSNAAVMVLLNALAAAVAASDPEATRKRLSVMNEIATRWSLFYPIVPKGSTGK